MHLYIKMHLSKGKLSRIIAWYSQFDESATCTSNWETQLQTTACTNETEKNWLRRQNRIQCTFRNQSCNPVCKKIKNGSIGLNSTESQKPHTIQHKWHPFLKETQGSLSQSIRLPSQPGKNPLLCWAPVAEQYGTAYVVHSQ